VSAESIDTIVHALPSPDMRQQALREIHLAPVDQLPAVVARWQEIASRWVHDEAPRIQTALEAVESTGKLPAEYEETAESADRMDAWRNQMQQLRGQRQAGAA
jgi:tRNA A37 N6-isopentenylltransferase MiaA